MEYFHPPQLTFETLHQSGPHKICGPRDHGCCSNGFLIFIDTFVTYTTWKSEFSFGFCLFINNLWVQFGNYIGNNIKQIKGIIKKSFNFWCLLKLRVNRWHLINSSMLKSIRKNKWTDINNKHKIRRNEASFHRTVPSQSYNNVLKPTLVLSVMND